jgi:hypothetical protein
VPKKELFEVFRSQGVAINDGKYTPVVEEKQSDLVDASSVATDTAVQNSGEIRDERVAITTYTVRKDTIVWLGVLAVLAIAFSFALGVNYGQNSSLSSENTPQRSVESLEVASVSEPSAPVEVAPPRREVAPPVSAAPDQGLYGLQIITYPNSKKWRTNAQALVKLLAKSGLTAQLKDRGSKLVVLVGDYSSKADTRIVSDKAVLGTVKIQNRYPFKKPLLVKK